MLKKVVVAIVRTSTRFAPITVVIAAILAVLGGIYSVQNFGINTDINRLISPSLDWRQRDIAFDKAFDQERLILAVVEAPTPEFANAAATRLTEKLSDNHKDFDSVQRLGGGEFFDKNGLLFLPTEQVAQMTSQFQAAAPLLEIMAGDPSLRGLTAALETGLLGIKRGEITLDGTTRPFSMIADTVDQVLKTGSATFSWRAW